MKKLSTIVLAAALLIACGKKDKEVPPAPAPTPAPAATEGSGSAASDTGTGSGSAVAAGSGDEPPPPAEEPIDVATEMDYEDLANTEITEATLEARLKALEAELSAQ